MTPEIPPCPFCDSPDVVVHGGLDNFAVNCLGCDAQGPWADTEEKAIALWSARPLEDRARIEALEGVRSSIYTSAIGHASWGDEDTPYRRGVLTGLDAAIGIVELEINALKEGKP